MLIECYLFSEITQQIGHTYYSGLNHYHKILHFNLSDYSPDKIPLRMFIYKVKVESNDVYDLFQIGVRAVKYEVLKEIPFSDYIREAILSKKTKAELTAILNGTVPENKVLKIYEDSIKKDAFNLTKLQTLRLHAILAQTKYEFPTLIVSAQTHRFLPLLEYYNKNYEIQSTLKPDVIKYLEYKAMIGSKKFECIKNEEADELLMKNNNARDIIELVRIRKFSQAQFEELCKDIPTKPTKWNYRDVNSFVHFALYANYEIPQEYYNLFMPHIVIKESSLMSELRRKHLVTTFTAIHLLKMGYKIKNFIYNGYTAHEIMKTREILKNDNYKYIDLTTGEIED